MKDWQYKYNVKLVKIVDADTIDVDVDLGFGTFRRERLRFARIDAWEMRGTERAKGQLAKAALARHINNAKLFIITHKDKTGKYGRYIADVWVDNGENSICMNDWLVEQGHAEYVKY